MLLPKRVAVGIALLVAVLTVSTAFYGAIGDVPSAIFGGQDVTVALDPRTETPLKGNMHPFLARDLGHVDGLQAASPELLSPTLIEGDPFMVRGARPRSYLAVEQASLRTGRLPGPGEAMVGARAAQRLDVGVGDRLVIGGSYASRVIEVEVVGVFAGGSNPDDVVVPVPTARPLVRVDGYHFIRARTTDPFAFRRAMTSLGPHIMPLNLTVSQPSTLPGDRVRVDVRVKNWGRTAGTKRLTLEVDGRPVRIQPVQVGAQSYATASFRLRLVDPGRHRIQVNPSSTVEVEQGPVNVSVPDVVATGTNVTVELTGNLSGVDLTLNGTEVPIEGGQATVRADEPGRFLLLAKRGNRTLGGAYLRVVAPELIDLPRPKVVSMSLHPPSPEVGQPTRMEAVVTNLGGQPVHGEFRLTRDGRDAGTVRLDIPPVGRQVVTVTFPAGPRGRHAVAFLGEEIVYPVGAGGGGGGNETPERSTWYPGKPQPETPGGTQTAPAQVANAVVARTIGDVRTAVLGLSVVTGLLVLLGMTAVVGKGLADRRRPTAVLRSIGADRLALLRRLLREAVPVAAAGAVAGVALGLVLAWLIGQAGWIRAFGRTVLPDLTPTLALQMAGLGAGLALAALLGLFWRRAGRTPAELFERGTEPAGAARDPVDRFADRTLPGVRLLAVAVAGVVAAQALGRVAGFAPVADLTWLALLGAGALAWLDLQRRAAPDRHALAWTAAFLALYGPLLAVVDPAVAVLPLVAYAVAADRPLAGLVVAGAAAALSPATAVVPALVGAIAVRDARGRRLAWPVAFVAIGLAGLVAGGRIGPALLIVPAVALVGRIVLRQALVPGVRGDRRGLATAVAVSAPATLLVAAIVAPGLGLSPLVAVGAVVAAVAHVVLAVVAVAGLHAVPGMQRPWGRAVAASLVAPAVGLAVFLPRGGEGVLAGLPFLVWGAATLVGVGAVAWKRHEPRATTIAAGLSLLVSFVSGLVLRLSGLAW